MSAVHLLLRRPLFSPFLFFRILFPFLVSLAVCAAAAEVDGGFAQKTALPLPS
jgi:hypothetical protein